MMRIALIWPYGFDTEYVIPMSLAYLKSNLDNQKHEVRIFDNSIGHVESTSEEFRNELRDFNPSLVGISCWCPTYEEALKILWVVKSINERIITIMGGAYATSYPDKIMESKAIDFLFRGEADLSFPRFVDELESDFPNFSNVPGLVYRDGNNAVIKNEMERAKDLDVIKTPDYEAIDIEKYIQSGYRLHTTNERGAPIWVTRGCPYRCAFCSAPLQNGRLVRTHSIEYMVRWIKDLYENHNIRQINIIDDNFTFHVGYAKEFCKAIINLNLKDLHMGTPNGIRIQRTDRELLHLMKKAGWDHLIIAPESGSRDTLKRMKKDLDPDIIPDKVKEIKEAGLRVHGFFIVGYPGETIKDIEETVKLLRKCKFNFFFFNNFQPLPGTPVYDELVENKEIKDGLLPKDYSGGDRVYVPKDLKNFNFSKLLLREYMYLAMSDPKNIPYMLNFINPRMAVKKVYSNLYNMIAASSYKVNDEVIEKEAV